MRPSDSSPALSKGSISIILPHLGGGGAERLHVNLANDWIERGYSVEFILLNKRGELLELLRPEITVTDLAADRIRVAITALALYLGKTRPDVILCAMWPLTSAVVLSWLLSGRRCALFLSDHEHLSHSYLVQRRVRAGYLKNLIRFSYPLAKGLIAVSQGVKDDLCSLGNLSEKKVKVIYNPAATGVCAERESSERSDCLWGKGFTHHLLAVGRLSVQKDFRTLINAFSLLPKSLNAKLVILGEGSSRKELEDLVGKLGLKEMVALPGFVVDPYPFFRSADLFVLSSEWEGFGNVIVEALECGLPVVSTDCPSGPSEILEEGRYGRLVPVGDAAALASAIASSLSESHDRELLMNRAKDFSVQKISDEYVAYLFQKGG
ncbi:MAG: glycosyltransferase [Chlorobiaceae bacterium]